MPGFSEAAWDSRAGNGEWSARRGSVLAFCAAGRMAAVRPQSHVRLLPRRTAGLMLCRGARTKNLGFGVCTFSPPWEGPVKAPGQRQSPSFTWAP